MYEDYLMSVRKDLSRYRVLQAGESLSFGGVKIDVINPILPLSGNLNEDSIVLRVRYGGIAILLTGDMGVLGERRLLNIGTKLKSQILKVGHHGADNSCSEEFLAAVGPQAAVITASAGNKYGRPRQVTLERLKAAGIKVYRTDLNGHIVLKTDGKVFSLHTEKPLNGDPK
jgi:competence protein ComEC